MAELSHGGSSRAEMRSSTSQRPSASDRGTSSDSVGRTPLKTRPSGVVEPNPAKEAIIPGALVSPVEGGVVNWPPPAYSPKTGLFYTPEKNGFNMLYLTEPDPRGSMGLGGKERVQIGSLGDYMIALDPLTGETQWRHEWPGRGGGGQHAAAATPPATTSKQPNIVRCLQLRANRAISSSCRANSADSRASCRTSARILRRSAPCRVACREGSAHDADGGVGPWVRAYRASRKIQVVDILCAQGIQRN